jgi:hypothetical protein
LVRTCALRLDARAITKVRLGLDLPKAPAKLIDRSRRSQPGQQGGEISHPLTPTESQGGNERLLEAIGRIRMITQQPVGRLPYRRAVLLDNCIPINHLHVPWEPLFHCGSHRSFHRGAPYHSHVCTPRVAILLVDRSNDFITKRSEQRIRIAIDDATSYVRPILAAPKAFHHQNGLFSVKCPEKSLTFCFIWSGFFLQRNSSSVRIGLLHLPDGKENVKRRIEAFTCGG